jgi:hypothetical protein
VSCRRGLPYASSRLALCPVCFLELVLDIEAWKTFARCSLPIGRATSYTGRHVFETVVSDCLEEGLVDGLDFTVDVSLRPTPIASSPSPARIEMLFAHRKRRPASSRRPRPRARPTWTGMKKCGAHNPITALDGALSCAYLDAEIDRRCLARCAMLSAGPAPARILS